MIFLIIVKCIAILLIVYHHIGYPWFIANYAQQNPSRQLKFTPRGYLPQPDEDQLPSITVLMPTYNEEDWISAKLHNLSCLDYPKNCFKVVIICDGCTDQTLPLIHETLSSPVFSDLDIEVIENDVNMGKTAILNTYIPQYPSDLCLLTDVSSLISVDALLLAQAYFTDKSVGIVDSQYQIYDFKHQGESNYWQYQTKIKQGESAFASSIGAHGACFLFRYSLFTPLPIDAINDDFILPMDIVKQGYRACVEPNIIALELEPTAEKQDFKRRLRISAGNMQQFAHFSTLLRPRNWRVGLLFFSGKGLRVLMPYLMIICLVCTLALHNHHLIFTVALVAQVVLYTLALLFWRYPQLRIHKVSNLLAYWLAGHTANLVGGIQYIACKSSRSLSARYQRTLRMLKRNIYNQRVLFFKRIFDIIAAVVLICLTLPFLPLIASVIKLSSSGPVFYKQLRVGKITNQCTFFFYILKFRTMKQDAEALSGAQWATENDPRITSVGRFLRKTRIDELPQLVNVLKGEMSLIGPRPERPTFYQKLNDEIPFFSERTYDILPGITGLAQVSQGYDNDIDDVRKKVGFDHRYALSLTSIMQWLHMDLSILLKTCTVVIFGMGR